MAESGAQGYDVQLARDHSLLLEERLRGSGNHGPTSFAGLLGSHATRVNEYAFLAEPDEDDTTLAHGQRPLQRWVSNIGKVVPSGVQLEPRKLPEAQMPPPAPRDATQHAQQPARQPRLSGRFAAPEGAAQPQQQQQQQQRRQPSPQPASGPVQAQAAPVPGNPLKIRLKISNGSLRLGCREGSAEKRTPPPPPAAVTAAAAAQLLQSVRQLGAGLEPPLSPIPAGWAKVVSSSSLAAPEAQPAARAPAQQAAPVVACQLGGSGRAASMPSPFESLPGGSHSQVASGEQSGPASAAAEAAGRSGGGMHQLQQQPPAPRPAGAGAGVNGTQQQPQARRQPSPPVAAPAAAAAGGGSKRAAPAAASGAGAPDASPPAPAQKRQRACAAGTAAPSAVAASDSASPGLHTPPVLPDGSAAVSGPVPPHGSSGSHSLARAHSSNLAPSQGQAPEAPQQRQPAAAPKPKQQEPPVALPASQPQQEPPQQPQQPGVPAWAAEALAGGSDDTRLGAVAAFLPAVLQPAASGELPGSRMVHSLQEEGKKLKKFAEKKMRDGRPTHVSSMFLCQSCVKFLTVAATMEAHPAKFSRESTSSMYSQTASLLDSCAHNAGRAEGPAMITTAISLLAQRLAAVARLRAAFCLRAEGLQQVAAFRGALEKASGETYQRPSPTDSNTSTSISVPLDPSGKQLPTGQGSAGGGGGSRSSTPQGSRSRSHAGKAGPPPPQPSAPDATAVVLVGMPKCVLERQLVAAQHSQAVLTALSSFGKSSERLREFMGQAAAQSNVHGLKVAAATLLLSADAGMGPANTVLTFAKDALDAVMQMQ